MRNEAEEESELAIREQKIYGDMPVPKAVATMIIPTIISQIITVIYNLADTWYVGLTNNAAEVLVLLHELSEKDTIIGQDGHLFFQYVVHWLQPQDIACYWG